MTFDFLFSSIGWLFRSRTVKYVAPKRINPAFSALKLLLKCIQDNSWNILQGHRKYCPV